MKSKKFFPLFFIIIILFCGIIWWFAPASLMKQINPNEISSIEVSGGNSGGSFSITDSDTITSIVTNIQNAPLKKSKISLMYSGALFDLSFIDHQGNTIYTLIVNDTSTIRKDPFFYHDDSGSICFNLLTTLETAS